MRTLPTHLGINTNRPILHCWLSRTTMKLFFKKIKKWDDLNEIKTLIA